MAAFTTIAAATALAMTAAGTAKSFSEASRQRKLRDTAEKKANEAFSEAEKMLDVNYMEQLSLSKLPYELEREAAAQRAAQALEVGRESGRQATAVAGRVLAQSQKTGQNITSRQTKDIESLEGKIVAEDSRLRDAKANLQLGVATGAGEAAMQAEKLRMANINQGWEGISNTLQAGMSEDIMPLYGRGGEATGITAPQFIAPVAQPTLYGTSAFQTNPSITSGVQYPQNNQVVLQPQSGIFQ
tara:strand:- start:23714 stop:24442 length:729 start_codon:yes stop_codon:yes gene_type:complete